MASGPESTATPRPQRGRLMPEFGRGTCVGRYVILDRIGAGGMGVVYRAYDPDLDRRVALKLVRDLYDEATRRLVQEAQALAKVSHPNIVAVFDVGTFGGSVFIAMELVEGRTLSQWHWAERPSWRDTLAKLITAGRGLGAAHAAGLIHRDFKPNNAIVGDDGRLRVLDFGLARLAASSRGDELDDESPFSTPPSPWTSTLPGVSPRPIETESLHDHTGPTVVEIPAGEVEARAEARLDGLDATTDTDEAAGLPRVMASRIIGTPVYMAPEQRRRGVIDSRADQYAFAVTAWELLCGERPFDTRDAATYAAAAEAHQVRPAPAGSPVPAWVRRVLVRAMSPAPGDRYRSMDDLLLALGDDPSAQRRRIVAVVAALGLVALAVFGLTWRGGAAPPPPCADGPRHLAGVWDDAAAARLAAAFEGTGKDYAADTLARVGVALDARARAWVSMHRDACEATRVRGEQSAELLDLRMGCLDRRRAELGALVDELGAGPDPERLRRAVEAVDQLPEIAACADRDGLIAVVPRPRDPEARRRIDEVRRELAKIEALVATGQYPAARPRVVVAVAAARATGWTPVLAEASYLHGQIERLAGDLGAAEAALLEAIQAAARAHLDDVAARAWTELVAVVGYEAARPVEGLALAHAAAAAIARAESGPMISAGLLHAEALTLSVQGRTDQALGLAQRSLALVAQTRGPDDVEAADVLNTIAVLVSTRGDHAAAEIAHRRALAIRVQAFGPAHPRVADSVDNLGVVLYHQGKLDEARGMYERALALRVAALGADHRDVGTTHNNLGGLFMDQGDPARATEHLEAALAIYQDRLGPGHADLAIPLSNLGELASRRGDHDRALDHCRRALALDEAAAGPDAPDLAFALVCIGEAHLGRGDPAAARPVLERALTLREHTDGDAAELARTRFAMAQALWRTATGTDRARARRLATAARASFGALGDASADRLAATTAWLAAPR